MSDNEETKNDLDEHHHGHSNKQEDLDKKHMKKYEFEAEFSHVQAKMMVYKNFFFYLNNFLISKNLLINLNIFLYRDLNMI
jgi:hypothetical protein